MQHDVVHFAGHAFAADTTPLAGRLQLSPEAGRADGGTLYADEIWKTRFTRTRLVVLAACRTGFGPVFRGEGTLDLAHPFLAAGVPTVVGALWDVRDTAAHSILVGFHRAYAAGRPAHEALRQAQLAALHESSPELRSPSGWAAFTTFTTTIR